MGGYSVEDDLEYTSALTLVLFGKTGNGKSATGNSIIGTKKFKSYRNACGVTTTSELKTTNLEDGRVLNVIDTPGMFDFSADPGFIGKEIVSCINMAKDGIHAVLVVFSVCCRFSEDENAALTSLVTLFGRKINDYVIVVFTGGDELEADGKTIEEFLCDSPKEMKEILSSCGNRYVLFDNRTKDATKKANQMQQLLSLVNVVLENNGGESYTNEMFAELKEKEERVQALRKEKNYTDQEMLMLIKQMHEDHAERVIEMLEETKKNLEQQLRKERSARLKAEKNAKAEQKKSKEEIKKLKEDLENANKASGWSCVIM